MSLTARFETAAGGFRLRADLVLPERGVSVVFGPSGAGKSLLLKTLAGLHPARDGRIAFGETALFDRRAGVNLPPHRRGLGLVFQDARLFPHLTVRGNLEYARRRLASGRGSLGGAPDVADMAERLDLSDLLDRQVRHLSGGEKSRVALARAILGAPRLLMLDEPFAALDARRRRAFIRLLLRLNAETGVPMMVVTHVVEDAAELADVLLAMRSGETLMCGPASEVAASPAFLALLDKRDHGVRMSAQALKAGDADGLSRGAWLRADTVLLAVQPPHGVSARHVWPGRLEAMNAEEDGSVLARIVTGQGAVLSRITSEAARDLSLSVGQQVWVVFKLHAY